MDEVEAALKSFTKEKSPGPDGWTVELFLHFFDFMGPEILKMVEYSCSEGYMSGGLNSTFLTLIPKTGKPASFGDFRPIALCNLTYKLITKIISIRLKPILSVHITAEQFGFLKDHQILVAIGTTQEIMHTVKVKRLKAMFLKMDLEKAYDRVDWFFLRLVLIHIGMPPLVIRWIVACVTTASIAVLINGAPSSFFRMSRGIRQGCPLSPLFFLLIIDGLSRMINAAKVDGTISGIKINQALVFTHVLFVDDVLLVGCDSDLEWQKFMEIISIFSAASGMKVSVRKSCAYHSRLSEQRLAALKNIVSFNFQQLEGGFMYLGYFLKPNGYRINHWVWLLRRVEQKISHWTFRLLSIGGRLILVKSVLIGIPIYWLSLHRIPVSILSRLRRLFFNFLWTGAADRRKLILTKWESIALPTDHGGWGIRNLTYFGIALRMKSFWRSLFGTTSWSKVISAKYLNGDAIRWLRNPVKKFSNMSIIWNGFLKIYNWMVK